MSFLNLSNWAQISASARWVMITDILCLLGIIVCAVTAFRHALQAWSSDGEKPDYASFRSLLKMPLLIAALVCMSVSVLYRYVEVNHFPSQTMSEVLNMFTLALLASMVVLHYALAMHRRSPGWAIIDDALVLLVLIGVFYTHKHVATLTTGQRDLPPALQSYWFAPHLSALIFSYATMGISALICMVYFTARYWTAAFTRGGTQGGAMLAVATTACALLFLGLRGQVPMWAALFLPSALCLAAVLLVPRIFPCAAGASGKTQPLTYLGLAVVPFVQVVTLPILVIVGLIFLGVRFVNKLPEPKTMAKLERELDSVSFRAFAVGIPFLTGGLWMGAFWAQEAWANYWGWDSKENSALITWLVYVVYIHLRMLGGYRGEKAMTVLIGGALSVFLTFQVFGYLPDSQKSLHRYTDDGVQAQEGQMGPRPDQGQASAPPAATPGSGQERAASQQSAGNQTREQTEEPDKTR
jgi:ABC-type transport system involved in cytochrome c biogenesis permease subunit